jgi:hypothetical protein
MSLAFALAAAINGSTGSRATLSFGLERTKPHRRLSGGSMILIAQGWRRKPPESLSCESGWQSPTRRWENGRKRSHPLSRPAQTRPACAAVWLYGQGCPCPHTDSHPS